MTKHHNRELERLKRAIVKILKKNGIKQAGIFGSYARGNQTRKSDIDILIQPTSSMSLFEFVGVKQDLEERLGKKVDLISYRGIRPELRERILSDEVKIL